MSKAILRPVLLAAAALLTLNLGLFSYARFAALPLLGAALLLAALVGLGEGLAALFRVRAAGCLEHAALGLMAATAYFYAVSALKLLNPFTVVLFYAVALAVLAKRFFAAGGGGRRDALRRFLSRPITEYAVFLLPLAYAALPPSFYDTLVYHLGIPNLYLQSGGFVATPHFAFANTFIYYEISLIPAVFLGDLAPRLFHFLLGALFILAAADEGARWGVKSGTRYVVALTSLPMTLFLLVTCKNDLAIAIFVFLAIVRFRRGDWKLAAAFWGFAVGVKYFALLPLALFMLVAFKPWRRDDLRKLALTGMIVLLAVSPLLVKNWRFTGNPFFPFLHSVFPSANWDAGRFALMQEDVGRMVGSPAAALRLPYDLSFYNHGYGGLVGPLFLIFLPFLLLAPVGDTRWLLWALLVLATAPFLTASLRFVFAAFVVLAVFAVRAYENTGGRLARASFGLVLALNFAMGFAMLEKFYQAHTAWGGIYSPEEYRGHFFPAYPAFAFLNRQAPAGARVLLVGEARSYYLKRPCQLSSAIDHGIANRYLAGSRDAREFIAAVRRDGFAYLLVNFSELERLQGRYAIMSAGEKDRLLSFLRALPPVFRQGAVAVYRCG